MIESISKKLGTTVDRVMIKLEEEKDIATNKETKNEVLSFNS